MPLDPLTLIPTRDTLRRGRSLIPSFLVFNTIDLMKWEDDFVGASLYGGEAVEGDATLLTRYQSTASGAASAAAGIATGVVNGVVRLDPGTANAGRSDLSLGRHFRGDRYAVCWWRGTLPAAITSFKFELGFTDVVSGTDAGAVNAKSTPTWTADDAVVFVFDTDDDTNLTLAGVAATVGATAENFDTALVASTAYYFGIALRGTRAKGFLLGANGDFLEESAWMTGAVTEDVLLTPWAFVQNRSANQRLLDIDYLLCYQWRTTTQWG